MLLLRLFTASSEKAHFFLGFEGAATGAKPELAVLRAYLGGEP